MAIAETPFILKMAFSTFPLQWLHFMPLMISFVVVGSIVEHPQELAELEWHEQELLHAHPPFEK